MTDDVMNPLVAEGMGLQLQGLAARRASLDFEFLHLVGQFDAGQGWASFAGAKSTAHYLAWACSVGASASREQVRVARALRGLPVVSELFAAGRLSYSKVRELTRVSDELAEAELCALALEMTASQLARTVSAYRGAAGTRIRQVERRRYSSRGTADGMVRISIVLAPEEAALVDAAVEAAARRGADDGGEPLDRVQGLLDVAAGHLDRLPGEPADDHTLVVVQVSAESLVGEDVPAAPDTAARSSWRALEAGACHVVGQGPVEPAVARRLACTALLQGVLTADGEVLRMGRAKRLATRAQRRALRVRDHGVCQFPGCHQTRHLDAHHVIPWWERGREGGPTDLENLVLVCRRHHVVVHEGGLTLTRSASPWRRFEVRLPDGRLLSDAWLGGVSAETLEHLVVTDAAARGAGLEPIATFETEIGADDPARIAPRAGGEGFSLHECVRVLFDIRRPDAEEAA